MSGSLRIIIYGFLGRGVYLKFVLFVYSGLRVGFKVLGFGSIRRIRRFGRSVFDRFRLLIYNGLI